VRDLQAARGASLSDNDLTPDHAAADDSSSEDTRSRSTPGASTGGGAGHPPAAPPSQPAGSEPVPAALPTRARQVGLLLATAAVVVALDVVTKVLVVARLEGQAPLELLDGRLLLRVTRNPGAAFSFATGATAVFTVIALTVVVAILVIARRVRSRGWAVALGLLLGGAAGNLVDRLLRAPGPGRGAVVDFIDFQVWPSFNIADSGVVCGGVLAVLLSIRGVELNGRRDSRDAPP
jgi:signal peptidase II